MNRRLTVGISVATLALCVADVSVAFVTSFPNLKRDAKAADVICVGRVLETTHGPTDADTRADYETVLRVDRVMKGDVDPGSTITVHYSQQVCYPLYPLSGYDLLLLNRKDGGLVFSKNSNSSLAVSEKTRSKYTRSDDVEENLRWEVMNALQASPDFCNSPFSLLYTQADLLALGCPGTQGQPPALRGRLTTDSVGGVSRRRRPTNSSPQ